MKTKLTELESQKLLEQTDITVSDASFCVLCVDEFTYECVLPENIDEYPFKNRLKYHILEKDGLYIGRVFENDKYSIFSLDDLIRYANKRVENLDMRFDSESKEWVVTNSSHMSEQILTHDKVCTTTRAEELIDALVAFINLIQWPSYV